MRPAVALLILCVLASAPADCQAQGTFGVPFCNDLFLDAGPLPGILGPPGGAPCLTVPPLSLPPGLLFSLVVTTANVGVPVVLAFTFNKPCMPGFVPLPLTPCGQPQSIDLNVIGSQVYFIPGFSGLTTPVPGLPFGIFRSPVVLSPGIGLPVEIQALIIDSAGAVIVSNAIEIIV